MLAYPISGGCLNPAIGVGINLINVIATGNGAAIYTIYVYALVPFGGGILASLFYERLYKKISFSENDLSALE